MRGLVCDVNANHREVAGLKLKDVGATLAADRLRSALVGIGAETAEKFWFDVHANEPKRSGKIGKDKIAHISGFYPSHFLFWLGIVPLPYRKVVGQQIRAYRKQADLSQEELAEKASLSYKYLGEVERGYVNVSLDSLMRIAKSLKVKVHDLTRDV